MTKREARKRLECLRKELRAECISMGELFELQSLAVYIEPDDVELLEAAGVPEGFFPFRRKCPSCGAKGIYYFKEGKRVSIVRCDSCNFKWKEKTVK